MQATLQHAVITVAQALKCLFKAELQANKGIAAGRMTLWRPLLAAPQKVLGHAWNKGAGKEIRGQHGEYHRLSQQYKQVFRYTSKEEHGNKYDANCQRRHNGWSGNL